MFWNSVAHQVPRACHLQ